MLDHALRPCMGHYKCNDMIRARDLLRSHVCAIYECLKEAYGKMPLSVSDWEKEMAEEAVEIARSVWRDFNVSPDAYTWTETLTQAIVLHEGHPLRSGQAVQQTLMAAPQSPPPLLKMAMDAPLRTRLLEPDTIATKLKALKKEAHLSYQKIADGIDVDIRTVQRHLYGEAEPRDAQIAAYEEFFSGKLGKKIKLP